MKKSGRMSLLVMFGFTALTVGCVDRRFVVETNVPGAQIYFDGIPIGPSPSDAKWEYAGCYEFTAVAPGYETLTQRVKIHPKWTDYPPLDFFAEVLWPFRIEDVRRVQLVLEPTRPVNQLELISAADALRSRGQALPQSTVRDEVPRSPGSTTQPARPSQAAQPIPNAIKLPSNTTTIPPGGATIPPSIGQTMPLVPPTLGLPNM